MGLPGPVVGDYLKPVRDAYRRSAQAAARQFRTRTGVPHPAPPEEPEVAGARKRGKH